MVLPLFLMAGGAANEYKATLRAEAEAQARLNEAAVTAEHNKNMKKNLKPYGNIDVELPKSGDLHGMGVEQRARQNADFYMNWAQLPSNIDMLKANDPSWNNILMGDIVESFQQSIFQPTVGDTAGKKDTYTKYNYDHLKESWPELYEELNKNNPWLLPNINLTNGIDMEKAFMEADKVYDIVEGKERKEGENASQLIFHKDHEAIFGKDYAKNILTSVMYGGMSEEQYQMLKANRRKYQYTSIIASLTWRLDNTNMDDDIWGNEVAQVKTFYNLSDEEVIDAMARGMRKKSFENKSNRVTINNFTPIQSNRLNKIADSKTGYREIIKDVKHIKRLFTKGAKTGIFGRMTNVMYGVFGKTASRADPTGDIQGQIDWLKEAITEIGTNPNNLFGLDIINGEQEETSFTIEHGSIKGTSQSAKNSFESNANLVARLEGQVKNLETLKANQHIKAYGRGQGNEDNPLTSIYYQAQLETLQIYLAYKLALTEQGSGGKAVSDKDFDNALKRVGDTWWINTEQATSRLDLVAHKAARSLTNNYIHTEYGSQGISDTLEQNYDTFKDQEEKYVKSLRNYFILKKDAEMTHRAKTLETTFAIEGEVYGDPVDYNPWNDSDTAEGRGSFWAINSKLSPDEKVVIANIQDTFNDFQGVTLAADGIIVEGNIQELANNLKKLYSNPSQDSKTDSMMIQVAKMLEQNIPYEKAIQAVSNSYENTTTPEMISIFFIDLMKQGHFDSILGKNWYTKAKQSNRTRTGGQGNKTFDNPIMPSKKHFKDWEEYYRNKGLL
jgi:hypothetical protein